MKRKLMSFVLTGAMVLSLSATASATNTGDYYSMSSSTLAGMSGTSVAEIEEAKDYYGAGFNSIFEDYITNIRMPKRSGGSASTMVFADAETGVEYSNKAGAKISQDHWDFMKEKFEKGQILVTDDSATFTVDHGHSAILVSTTRTVEHLGKTNSPTSGYYDVGWWQSFNTMKSYNYSSKSVMSKAADYAYNNLQGWKYNAFSDRDSNSTVNCATLVWKAYNSQGVNIVNSTSGVVYPVNIDKSTKLSWVRSIGWNNVTW